MESAGNAIASGTVAQAANSVARQEQSRLGKMDQKQADLIDAQILEARSRTILNTANAKRALVGPAAGPDDPFAMRQENALIKVRLEDGTIVQVPNPDVYEIGPSELLTGRAILESGRAVHHLTNQTSNSPGRHRTTQTNRARKGDRLR